jgi:hypothetical protein
MTRKLDLHASHEVVHRALRHARPTGDLLPHETLGELLPSIGERHSFQRAVFDLVKERDFEIKLDAIPIDPGIRIGDITHALTVGALPGNPSTKKPRENPPAPPPTEAHKTDNVEVVSEYEESEES